MEKKTYNRAKEIMDILINIQDVEDAFKSAGTLPKQAGNSTYFRVSSCTSHFEPFSIAISDALSDVILASIRQERKLLEEEFKQL